MIGENHLTSGDHNSAEAKPEEENQQQQHAENSSVEKYSLPHLVEIPENCSPAIQATNRFADHPPTSAAFHKLFIIPTAEDAKPFEFPFLHLLNHNDVNTSEKDESARVVTTLEEAVDEFLSQTACLQITPGPLISGINPVQYAACLGNILFVKKVYDIIVEKTKGDEELRTKLLDKIFRDTVASNDRSMSEFVCRGGNVEMIKFFHSKNWLFPSILNSNGGSPIFVFIQGHDDVETLKFLHKEAGGILENFKSKDDENYLHLAIRKNRKNIVKYLLEHSKIDPNAKSKEDESCITPFALAAQFGHDDEIIRMLFKHGGARVCLEEMKASLESVDKSAKKLRTLKPEEKVEDLIALANPGTTTATDDENKDEKKSSGSVTIFVKPRYFPVIPINDALKLEQQDKRRQELEEERKKQQQQQQLEDSTNALAKPTNEVSSAALAADKFLPFIDPNRRYILQGQIRRTKLESPLHGAAENEIGGLAIAKFLCEEAGFDGDKNRHCLTSTPVYIATTCNNIEVVRYLVEERKADPTAADDEGCSACYVAAYYNYHEIIRVLLKNGANSSVMYKGLMTPAISAASSNSLEAMIALAEGGGDVSTPFSTSSNVIDYARQRGNDRIAEYLISFGTK